MSNIAQWFGWKSAVTLGDDLPDIFPIAIKREDFVKTDVMSIYSKILTDVVERTNGITDDQMELLWDNCLKSSKSHGLITMLAQAITDKKDLFIVYDKAIGIIREATAAERTQIETDYKTKAESPTGVYVSFKEYKRVDMVKLYSSLEFVTVGALNKKLNLSKALQIKLKDLRASVGAVDATDVKAQAKAMATGLAEGKDIMADKEDMIELAVPDLKSEKEAIQFIDSKRAFYLGVSLSYINGEQTGGLGTTGENDTKGIERGLKNYYFSIIKPVLSALFGSKLTYKSQDFRQIGQALEAMKTFSLVGEEHLNLENQKKIVEGMLDIDPETNKTPKPAADVPRETPAPAPVPPPQGNA